MDTDFEMEVICCFCGEPLRYKHAVLLTVHVNYKCKEPQQIFCHKEHLVEKVDKMITLHPSITEDNRSV